MAFTWLGSVLLGVCKVDGSRLRFAAGAAGGRDGSRSQRTHKHIEEGRWAGVPFADQPAELCAHITGIWHFLVILKWQTVQCLACSARSLAELGSTHARSCLFQLSVFSRIS